MKTLYLTMCLHGAEKRAEEPIVQSAITAAEAAYLSDDEFLARIVKPAIVALRNCWRDSGMPT